MLESPESHAVPPKEKSAGLDNEQAIATIAGLYMGEGNFTLQKQQHKDSYGSKNKFSFHIDIGFANSDPALIDYVCSFLEANGIAHFTSKAGGIGCYQVRIGRHLEAKQFIDMIEPYMFGTKLYEARILRRFVEHRMKMRNGNQNHKFCQYDERDEALAAEKLQLRESSEAIRILPNCYVKHRHVQ